MAVSRRPCKQRFGTAPVRGTGKSGEFLLESLLIATSVDRPSDPTADFLKPQGALFQGRFKTVAIFAISASPSGKAD